MAEQMDIDLHGMQIWVTRNEPQSHSLCSLLEQAGAGVVAVPALAIEGPVDPAAARERLASALTRADLAVFVSRNAVDWTWRLLDEAPPLPASIGLLAVGPATAAELRQRGVANVQLPASGADSEALLALPLLAEPRVRGRRVVIVRGDGGRALLGDTLRARGAEVEYVEVYRRCPNPDMQARLPELWREQPPQGIVVSSPAGLQALIDMTDAVHREQLYDCPLVAIGRHLAEQAGRLGFRRCHRVSAAGGDRAVLETLAQLALHFSRRGRA